MKEATRNYPCICDACDVRDLCDVHDVCDGLGDWNVRDGPDTIMSAVAVLFKTALMTVKSVTALIS